MSGIALLVLVRFVVQRSQKWFEKRKIHAVNDFLARAAHMIRSPVHLTIFNAVSMVLAHGLL